MNDEQYEEKDCRSALYGSNKISCFEMLINFHCFSRVESNKVQHGLCYSNDLLLFIVCSVCEFCFVPSLQTIRNFELLLLRFSFVRLSRTFRYCFATNALKQFDFIDRKKCVLC